MPSSRDSDACSRQDYRVSASNRDLLRKNIGLCFRFSTSLNNATLTKASETARYRKSVSSASGLARIDGLVRYCLIAIKAWSHYKTRAKLNFFEKWQNGKLLL